MKEIDTRGYSCPTPVMMVKEAIENGDKELTILIDNGAARANIMRLLDKLSITFVESNVDGDYVFTVK